MARKVFFSFHYDSDIWRVNQVRNSWVTKSSIEEAGYIDKASWEKVEKQGEEAVKNWINRQLEGTSVTVVLIGTLTSTRYYVDYEIKRSYERGNGMLGIYIHQLGSQSGVVSLKGNNPFGNSWINQANGNKLYLSQIYPTYDWVDNDGYNNIGAWVEAAAKRAGK